jgi:hypothetical protein
MRDDVVDSIAAQLADAGAFDPAHALMVRPLADGYQIIQGHHRRLAAEKAGIETLPCWVREMSDDDAYMQLALGNAQGELSPLEIGIHALHAVEPSGGGRGVVGGLAEYARVVGKTHQYISQLRAAAEVLREVKPASQLAGFQDKSQHLFAIHDADKSLWPALVALVTDESKKPSVKQVSEYVKQAKAFKDALAKIDPETGEKGVTPWADVFLPLAPLFEASLDEKRKHVAPQNVTALVQKADAIADLIATHAATLNADNFTYTVKGFTEWLREGVGTYAWHPSNLEDYRSKVVAAAIEAAKAEVPEPDPQPGEWWQLGRHMLYCGNTGSAAFVSALPQSAFAFADPPYNANAAEWDTGFVWNHDWLIDKAPIVAVTPGIGSIAAFYTEQVDMPYVWSMAAWITNGMTRGALGFGNWIYIALFSTLKSLDQKAQDVIRLTIKTSQTEETDHKGRKPAELLEHLLNLFSQPGDTVIDPFLGSGTTLFVADETGRTCFGGEISPEFCKAIIEAWQEKTGLAAQKWESAEIEKAVA